MAWSSSSGYKNSTYMFKICANPTEYDRDAVVLLVKESFFSTTSAAFSWIQWFCFPNCAFRSLRSVTLNLITSCRDGKYMCADLGCYIAMTVWVYITVAYVTTCYCVTVAGVARWNRMERLDTWCHMVRAAKFYIERRGSRWEKDQKGEVFSNQGGKLLEHDLGNLQWESRGKVIT